MNFPGNIIKIILTAVTLTIITILFFPTNPEKAVKRVLKKGHTAIEAGNLKATMSLISLSYHDDLGLNYSALRGSFSYTFSEYKNIKAEYRIIDFKTNKDTCAVEIEVRVKGFWSTASQEIHLAGAENVYEKVFIVCKKEGRRWKVIRARWPNRKDSLKMFSLSISDRKHKIFL